MNTTIEKNYQKDAVNFLKKAGAKIKIEYVEHDFYFLERKPLSKFRSRWYLQRKKRHKRVFARAFFASTREPGLASRKVQFFKMQM